MKTNEEIMSDVITESANILMCREAAFHEHMWHRARQLISYSDDNFAGLLQKKFCDVPNPELLTELRGLSTLAHISDDMIEAVFAWQVLERRYGEREAMEWIRPGDDYLSNEFCVVARKARLDQIYVSRAIMKGRWINPDEREKVNLCYSRRSSDELSIQLQTKYTDYLKCVHIVLRQEGGDVVARADWAANTTPDRDVGYDFESQDSWSRDDHKVPIATKECSDGYGIVQLRCEEMSVSDQSEMPLLVYSAGARGPWSASGYMGNVAAMKIKEDFKDPILPSPCLKVEYDSPDGWVGLRWQDPSGDWGERLGGANLTRGNTLFFRARGENGGEKIRFFIGGINGKMINDTVDRGVDVELTNEWKLYRIDLDRTELSRVKSGFGFSFEGQGHPIAFYINNIYYDDVHDSQSPGISENSLRSLIDRAEFGDPVAQYELGVRAEKGMDFKKDIAVAKKWYQKAATNGNARAAETLKRFEMNL